MICATNVGMRPHRIEHIARTLVDGAAAVEWVSGNWALWVGGGVGGEEEEEERGEEEREGEEREGREGREGRRGRECV